VLASSKKMAACLTPDQVSSQIRLAIKAADLGGFVSASYRVSTMLAELGLFLSSEQEERLKNLLQEIALEHQSNPACYNGPHPPNHLSGEPKCKDLRMLQFAWNSNCFDGRKMYIKFCLNGNRLVLISLHVDYEPGKFSKMEEKSNKK
jgi:hypothetical protein